MLDGHPISDMERIFLMNWKAMRKARRKQQKKSHEQISCDNILSELASNPSIKKTNSSISVPPLILPALPPRELPHRCKKVNQQDIRSKLPQLAHHNQLEEPITGELKRGAKDLTLPEIAHNQGVITQASLWDSSSNNQLPENMLWRSRAVVVTTGSRDE